MYIKLHLLYEDCDDEYIKSRGIVGKVRCMAHKEMIGKLDGKRMLHHCLDDIFIDIEQKIPCKVELSLEGKTACKCKRYCSE